MAADRPSSAEVSAGAAGPSARRVLPDGCVDVIWSSDGRLIVAGPDTVATFARWAPGVRHVGVRFDPGRAPAYLGIEAGELRDSRPELAELWEGGSARRLAERLAASGGDPAAVLEATLADRPRAPGLADPLVPAIVAAIGARSSISRIAAAAGVSERQLLRRSRRAFGYGPKTLARILRLQHALRAARRGDDLATVAVEAGYTDQAHLARDVRALAGTTLTGLLRPPDSAQEEAPGGLATPPVGAAAGSAAKRSTWVPSGSRTVA
jgi:AraC-like DNA-binding protein